MTSQKITFPSADGHDLAARLDMPSDDRPPTAYALFAHCFTCSKDLFAASRISAGLAARGIAVLRFDFTGLGASEGEFANTNFSSNVADLAAAADWLRRERKAPAILIGHSLGGAAVLAAAPDVPEAKAVVTIGAPSGPDHVVQLFQESLETITSEGRAEVAIAGRSFTITRQFLEDIQEQRLSEIIASMRKALLVFHAPLDEIVGIDNAGRIFGAAKHPKSFVSLDDADHLLTRREDAVYVADVIEAWCSRYLGTPAQAVKESVEPVEPAGEEGLVVVSEAGNGRFTQEIVAGRHRLTADEPRVVGGDDRGLTPYDLLLAALGSCTTMTIRMYAERKSIPLEKVSVTLHHGKVHAEDCADCETRQGKIDVIDRKITLHGDLDQTNRDKLMEIADKCPVHRTLHSEIKVRTTLV